MPSFRGIARYRLQVPFRKDLRPALFLLAAREGRTTASLTSHMLERVIVQLIQDLVEDEPELALELERYGVPLNERDRIQDAIAAVTTGVATH